MLGSLRRLVECLRLGSGFILGMFRNQLEFMTPPILNGSDPRAKKYFGKKFYRLSAIRFVGVFKNRQHWEFKCDCGKIVIRPADRVASGKIASCGCLRLERLLESNTRHGRSKCPIYTAWQRMKQRCHNPRCIDFKHYGGRGIKVCARWNRFKNFFEDMGERPTPNSTVERRCNNDGYNPNNCYWASRKIQAQNTRRSVKIALNGETLNLSTWSERLKIGEATIRKRIKMGWPPVSALTTPVRVQKT